MKRFFAIVLFVGAALAAHAQGLAPKDAFAALKKLVGTWEMTSPDGQKLNVIYKVTGAGSALIETQFPGQPHEMVSVYHMDGKDLYMTHYCAAGNQPTMKYIPGKDKKVLFFDFVRGSNMKLTDMHIHSAKIMLNGADAIKSDWTGWMNKKKGDTVTFDLKRVK
jgi:hypothetical protein